MNIHLTREQYQSLLLTIVVSLLIVLMLFLFGFRTPLPLPEEKGVVIEVGGGGGLSTLGENLEEYKLPPQPTNTAEKLITQENEETGYTVPEVKQQKPTPDEKATSATHPTQPTQPQIDNRLVNAASILGKGKNKGTGGSGAGSGEGTGGGVGEGTGTGIGDGAGPSYSLKGRTAQKIPTPSEVPEEGIVVVTIWVDQTGKVIRAEPGAIGTTTSNKTLWEKAKNAALQAQFNPDDNAPEVQKGTIRYVFVVRK